MELKTRGDVVVHDKGRGGRVDICIILAFEPGRRFPLFFPAAIYPCPDSRFVFEGGLGYPDPGKGWEGLVTGLFLFLILAIYDYQHSI